MGNNGKKAEDPQRPNDLINEFISWQKVHDNLGHMIEYSKMMYQGTMIDQYRCRECDDAWVINGRYVKNISKFLSPDGSESSEPKSKIILEE